MNKRSIGGLQKPMKRTRLWGYKITFKLKGTERVLYCKDADTADYVGDILRSRAKRIIQDTMVESHYVEER